MLKQMTAPLLLLFLFFSVPVFAFDINEAPHYVNVDVLSPALLPPPPTEDSSAWKKQIAGVVKAQQHVSASDRTAMKAEQHITLETITASMGPDFTAAHFPKTFALLQHVFTDTAIITEKAKTYWGTRRPYVAAPKQVKLLVDPVKNNAFPSGHTSLSWVEAEVIGLLYPNKRGDLRALADAIAMHRIEAGVHYPGDVEGGRRLGAIILGALLADEDFESDLVEAKEEIDGK